MPTFSPVILRGFPCRVTRLDDIVYASPDGQPLLVDLYLPDEAARPLPVIVFLHAGGWLNHDRRFAPDLGRFFAERGFAMASLDYRSSRQAIFPAALQDVIAGIQWLRSAGAEYGLDPERIGVWGASAGGHLAALAALSAPETRVRAVAAVYPPVDFLQMGEESASPRSYESRFLGAPIRTVPESQSELLYEALRAAANHVTLSVIEGLEHGFLNDNRFDQGPQRRHRLRASRPGEPEQVFDAPPLTFGTFETFFKRHV